MAAPVILVDALPRRPGDGVVVPVALAGAGGALPYPTGYRAGIAALPTIAAALDFSEQEMGGGGVAQSTGLIFSPAQPSVLAAIAGYYWRDAAIAVRIGPEDAGQPPIVLAGTVLEAPVQDNKLQIGLADPAAALKRPMIVDRFAGTGGLEGPVEMAGVAKPRCLGRCFNVPGRMLDFANKIVCFGDPARRWQAFDVIRDQGAIAEPARLSTVAWQGSAAATFAALQAAVATQGGGVMAPDIACIKWWTDPGDLTADIRGEIAGGYVETAPEIAARIVAARSTLTFVAGTIAAAAAARPAIYGLRVDDESTTAADLLSQILGDVSISWLLDGGAIVLRPWQWSAPAIAAKSVAVTRRQTLAPIGTRKLGYRRNNHPQSRGDLRAIVFASDGVYADGTSFEALKPAQLGATNGADVASNVTNAGTPLTPAQLVTALGTAQAIANQGAFATLSSAGYGSPLLTGFGELSPLGSVSLGTTYIRRADGSTALTEATVITSLGTASGIVGQGPLATQSTVLGSQLPPGGPNLILDPLFRDAGYWSLYGSAVFDTTTTVALSALGVTKALRFPVAGGFQRADARPEPVLVGRSYNASGRALVRAGGSVTLVAVLRLYDRVGGFVDQAVRNFALSAPTADTLFDISTPAVTIPPGTATAGLIIETSGAPTGAEGFVASPAITQIATPSLVDLGDSSNMVPDADFREAANWGFAKMTLVPNTAVGKGAGTNKLRIDSARGVDSAASARIQAQPGKSYQASAFIEVVSGTTGALLVSVQYFDAAGGALGFLNHIAYADSTVAQRFSVINKTPANAASLAFFVYAYGGGDRVFFVSEPVIRPAATLGDGVLRQDGTTLLTDAAAVTSLGIASAIAGQGSLATAPALNRGNVLGYFAANSFSLNYTLTRQDGATIVTESVAITAQGVAAAIVGQAPTATNSDYSAITGTKPVPGADVTADNQASLGDVAPIVLTADYQGVLTPGQFNVLRSVRRYLGQVDKTPDTVFTVTASTGATVAINNAAGSDQRGTVTLSALTADSAVITVGSTFAGVTLYRDIPVSVARGNPPVSGGGGGGGTPGGPSVSSGPFTNPGTSTSYVTTVTLSAVTVGSSGTVKLDVNFRYELVNNADDTVSVYDMAKWQRSVGGGAFVDVASNTSGMPAQKYFQTTAPKGVKNYPGTHQWSLNDVGLTSGASVVYRLLCVADQPGYGVTAFSGSIGAAPQ